MSHKIIGQFNQFICLFRTIPIQKQKDTDTQPDTAPAPIVYISINHREIKIKGRAISLKLSQSHTMHKLNGPFGAACAGILYSFIIVHLSNTYAVPKIDDKINCVWVQSDSYWPILYVILIENTIRLASELLSDYSPIIFGHIVSGREERECTNPFFFNRMMAVAAMGNFYNEINRINWKNSIPNLIKKLEF